MPSPSEILHGLTAIANTWTGIAIMWHLVIGGVLAALVAGWHPTRRLFGVILALPLFSVSLFAWLSQNPFNGTLFALGGAVLGAIGAGVPNVAVNGASKQVTALGVAMIAFGWIYPHFLEDGSAVRYVYAAPTGLVPCPTLSVVVGFALLFDGLGSRAWSFVLATMGFFYGLFGTLRLGVYLDVGLIIGSAGLAAIAFRREPSPAAAAT